MRTLIGVAVMLVLSIFSAFGQELATLQGRVTDPTAAVTLGEAVTVTQVGTNLHRSTLTDDDGRYIFVSLPAGEYNLRAELGGFKVTELLDALREFKVESNSFSADQGRSGVVISAVTKSGTNALHGSIFEFIWNDVFDAGNFFAPRSAFLCHSFGCKGTKPAHGDFKTMK